MKTIEEKLEIYRAYLNGATIQWRSNASDEVWEDVTSPSFDYGFNDYRVKTEPDHNAMAKAYIVADGYVFWKVGEPSYLDKQDTVRAPEFDIIARNKEQK